MILSCGPFSTARPFRWSGGVGLRGRALFLWCASLAVASAPASAEPLTLDDAIAKALAHNPRIVAARLRAESAGTGTVAERSDFTPSLVPSVTGTREEGGNLWSWGVGVSQKTPLGTVGAVTVEKREGDLPEATADESRFGMTVSVTQPLLRGAGFGVNLRGIDRAEVSARIGRRSLVETRAATVAAVAQRYEALLTLQRLAAYRREALSRVASIALAAKAKEGVGKTSRVDALRAEYNTGRARLDLEETLDQLALAWSDLREVLGDEEEREYELAPTPLMDLPPLTPEEGVAVALANRTDYATAQEGVLEAGRDLTVAENDLWPRVDLFGEYRKPLDGREGLPAQKDYRVGVVAQTDLNLTRRRMATERSRLTREAAKVDLVVVRHAIVREVWQGVVEERRVRKAFEMAVKNHKLALSQAALARRLYRLGREDHVAVSLAEDALSVATVELYRGGAAVNLAVIRLKQILGTLVDIPDDLKPYPGALP